MFLHFFVYFLFISVYLFIYVFCVCLFVFFVYMSTVCFHSLIYSFSHCLIAAKNRSGGVKHYRLQQVHHLPDLHLTSSTLLSLMLSTPILYRSRRRVRETIIFTPMSPQIITPKPMAPFCTLNYNARTVMVMLWRRLVICTRKCRSVNLRVVQHCIWNFLLVVL